MKRTFQPKKAAEKADPWLLGAHEHASGDGGSSRGGGLRGESALLPKG